MIRALAVLVLLFLGVSVLAWGMQRRLIYFPFGAPGPPAGVGLAGVEEVSLETGDGVTVEAWLVPPGGQPQGTTVIVFNGNAGNRGMRAPLADAFSRAGIATILFDYRGYGGSSGSPTEEGLAADARAVADFVEGREDLRDSRVVYFGESLGAAVALRLALERPPAGLILRSPFTSMVDVGRRHYPFLPVSLLLKDRYPSLARIPRLSCPLLVIAGDRDRIVPFDLSRRLFEAAPEPKRLVVLPGADHNDYALFGGAVVLEAVLSFVEEDLATDLPEPAAGDEPG